MRNTVYNTFDIMLWVGGDDDDDDRDSVKRKRPRLSKKKKVHIYNNMYIDINT